MMHPRYFSMAEAAKEWPGHRCSTQKIYRLTSKGVIGPDGERVYLRSIKVAGRRLIPEDAIAEFISACSARPATPSPAQRRAIADQQKSEDPEAARRAEAADSALAAMGF